MPLKINLVLAQKINLIIFPLNIQEDYLILIIKFAQKIILFNKFNSIQIK